MYLRGTISAWQAQGPESDPWYKSVFGVEKELISIVLYGLVNSATELEFIYMVLYGNAYTYAKYIKCMK